MKGDEEDKLSMGCCERTQAQTGVSPQRGGNTKKDSARVTAKALSEMWTVTRGHIGWIIGGLESGQVMIVHMTTNDTIVLSGVGALRETTAWVAVLIMMMASKDGELKRSWI